MKLHSPIATYLCFYRIRLVAVLVLLMALAAPAKAQDIDGAEILTGNAVEGGLIIARTDPANQIMLDDSAVEIGENGIFVIGFTAIPTHRLRFASLPQMDASKPAFCHRANATITSSALTG